MFKIEKITEPPTGWRWNDEENHLAHSPLDRRSSLGIIQLVSIQNETGDEKFQQPWWLESRGEIDIIITPNKELVMVEVERHAVIPPEQYADSWAEFPPNPFDLETGVIQLELPRGFSNAIMEEAEEETRYSVDYVATIGHINPNTSFFGTSPLLIVYKAIEQNANRPVSETERIRSIKLLEPSDVANVSSLCGFTKAGLWEFCIWATKRQKDPLFDEVANNIMLEMLHPTVE